MRQKVSVSWRLGSFSVWEVERGRPGALVVGMAMPFSWEGVGVKPFFSLEVEKESTSSVWEENIFLGKASAAEVEARESFVLAVVWGICAVEEEELVRESGVFWQVEGKGFSCVYYF